NLFGLALEYLKHGYALDALFVEHFLEDRCFEDAEPDPQTDPDHDDADQEWNAPAPDQKLVTGKPAEDQHRQIGQEEPGRRPELRPGGDETAIAVSSRPFHRQQHRAPPFAADPDPLDQANDRQQHGTPDADALVGRHEAHGYGGEAGHQQCRDQGCLAADPVAPGAEYRRPGGPAQKPDEKDGERLEHADQWIGFGEEEFAEDQCGHLAVEQEIIPFDRRADRAGDHGAPQMRPMVELGKAASGGVG